MATGQGGVTHPFSRDLDVFPRALDSETNLLDESLGGEFSTRGQMGFFTNPSITPHSVSTAPTGTVYSSTDGTELSRGYNPNMSPLPEASQELTSSMSQPTDTGPSGMPAPNTASPTSRAAFVANSHRQQTTSPFRHAALPSTSVSQASDGARQAGNATRGVGDVAARNMSGRNGKPGWNSQPDWVKPSEERLAPSLYSRTNGSCDAVDHMTGSEVSLASSTHTLVNADISNTTRGGRLHMVPAGTHGHGDATDSRVSLDTHNLPRGLERRSASVTAVAPAPLRLGSVGLSHDTHPLVPRPLSPLVTTTINASNIQPQGGGPQPRPPLIGGGVQQSQSDVQLRQARASEHPAHQRQDSASRQHRISQDLEVMNLAISGMDSSHTPAGVSFSQPVYSHSRGGVANDAKATRRSEHHPAAARTQSASRKQHPRHQTPSNGNTPVSNHTPASNSHAPPHSGVPATSSGIGSASTVNATFRPITPGVAAGGLRTASAPISRSSEDSSPAPRTFSPNTSHASSVAPRQQQRGGNQPHVDPTRGSRQATGHHGQQGRNYQPPQVAADSYDYLPPYSPPTGTHTPPARPHPQEQQQQPQLGAFVGEAYPEPPPSYNAIFGGSSSNGNRREQTRQHRQPRDSSSLGRVSSSQSAQAESHQPSRQVGRLSSLTNLFRRGRKNTRSASENMSNGIAVEDYTAQWVESYSHTPRPSSVIMTRQQNESPLSRTASSPDPTLPSPYHNLSLATERQPSPSSNRSIQGPPIPYRPPPPLAQHVDTSRMGGLRGGLNSSLTRLPTDGHARSQTTAGYSPVVQRSPKDRRPRPASSYVPQDYRSVNDPHGILHQLSFTNTTPPPHIQTNSSHSTPHQPSRLVSPSNMSASCSDIATNQVKKGKSSSSRTSLRRRGSGRGPTLLQQQAPAGNREAVTISQGQPSSQLCPEDWVVPERSSAARDGMQLSSQPSAANIGGMTGSVSGAQERLASVQERLNRSVPVGQEGLTDPPSQRVGGLSGDNTSSTVVVSPQMITTPSPVSGIISPIAQASVTPSPVSHAASPLASTSSSPVDPGVHRSSTPSSPVGLVTSRAVSNAPSSISSPLASTAPSPVGPSASSPVGPEVMHRTGTPSSQVGLVASADPHAVSNASSSINIALSGSSVLSQVMPEASSSNPNLASSNVRSSTNSPTESSQSNSVSSSRAAARLRAESRRRSLISTHSSSEENVTSRLENGHTHNRPKRRRSQGVGNSVEGQGSLEPGTQAVGELGSAVPGGMVSSNHGDRIPSRSRSPVEQDQDAPNMDISRENPSKSFIPHNYTSIMCNFVQLKLPLPTLYLMMV